MELTITAQIRQHSNVKLSTTDERTHVLQMTRSDVGGC